MKSRIYAIVGATLLSMSMIGQAGGDHRLPQRASEVIGQEVLSAKFEKIGKVNDLVVNLPSGGTSFVIVSIGGLFGVGDQLIVVPIHRFEYQAEKKKLILALDSTVLRNAPSFDSEKAFAWNDPAWVASIENYYATSTTINGQASITPPSSKAEVNVDTQRETEIRQQLVASDLSATAKNVHVTSQNGSVTLQGSVQSEKERRELIAKVKAITGNAQVIDQLTIAKN